MAVRKDTRRGLLIGNDGFMLPLEVALDVLAGFARRGRGKTHSGSVWAEELYRERVPFAIIDIKGDWWGLRSNRAGNGPGIPVTILGGEHGDLPLSPAHGVVVADLIVDHPGFYLLDLSDFPTAGSRFRFLGEFAIRLFARKKKNRDPLHLIVDEAHTVFPQQIPNLAGDPDGQFAAMSVGAWHNIAKLGRQRGLGLSMWDQRPASVNKNDSSQAGVQAFGGITSSHDRKAIRDTLVDQADEETVKTVMASLPTLPRGMWQLWITEDAYDDLPSGLYTVQIRDRRTFDSSATPKIGERRVEPKILAPVDLESLREQMSTVIEQAKADDPTELRRRVAAVTKERDAAVRRAEQAEAALAAERANPSAEPATLEVPVPLLDPEAVAELRRTADALRDAVAALGPQVTGAAERVVTGIEAAVATVRAATGTQAAATPPRAARPPAKPPAQPRRQLPSAVARDTTADGSALPASMQRLLDTLAWFSMVGIDPVGKVQLAVFAGFSSKSGGYKNYLGALRSRGLIDYPTPGAVALTDAGRDTAVPQDDITTSAELHEALYRRLPGGQARILSHVIAAYPDRLPKTDLAALVDMSPTSGGYKNYLGALRSLGLIDYPEPGSVIATALLFLPDAA